MFMLISTIISVVLGVIDEVVGLASAEGIGILSAVYGLAVLIPSIAVTVRRLHDTGRTGWWILIGFIPVIGFIVLLVFMIFDSEEGSNQYGPNPKGFAA